MKTKDIFKKGKVYVWKEKFAVVNAKRSMPGAFAVIKDKAETTVVIQQSKVVKKDVIKIEQGWRVITFDMILPFSLVGFMAIVSKALADKGISIYAISAYSTDHVLVKETKIVEAVKALRALGCVVTFR